MLPKFLLRAIRLERARGLLGIAVRLGGASIMNVRPSLPPIAAQHDMAKRAACGHDYPVEGADDHGATEPVAKAPLDAD